MALRSIGPRAPVTRKQSLYSWRLVQSPTCRTSVGLRLSTPLQYADIHRSLRFSFVLGQI